MKIVLSDDNSGYTIKSYSEGKIVISGQVYTQNLILLPDQIISDWEPESFQALSEKDFYALVDLKPDLVLLGTGEQQQFPSPSLYMPLMKAGIGLETMNTAAACRTYNILMGEGRRVAAALFLN